MESEPTTHRISPMTDEELELALIESLKDSWPSMALENRKFYADEYPERVAASGLLLDAPFVKRRRGE